MISDRVVVATAVAIYSVAVLNPAIPGVVLLATAALAVAIGCASRRAAAVALALVALTSLLAQRSHTAIRQPAPEGPVAQWATVVRDPETVGAGVRVDLRIGHLRFESAVYGAQARAVSNRLVGDEIFVRGHLKPLIEHTAFTDQRHVVGRLTIDEVGGWHAAKQPYALANWLRRTLARGAQPLPREHRPLYAGLVFGDDREQPDAIADDFRGAGLGHLLAVSGQNVAFVVALVAPLLDRLTYRARFPAQVVVLALFAFVTRFEPSVLRATFMFVTSAAAAATGRVSTGRRNLALTTIALILIDPLIVTSVGFALSVLATAGIVELAQPLAARLPLPPPVAMPLAVTLAAQIAVAPLQIGQFGGLPVASVPANLMAAPLAGIVMTWGLSGGLIAGLAPAPIAEVLALPSRLLVAAIARVAQLTSGWRLGELRASHLVMIGILVLLLSVANRRAPRRMLAVAIAAIVILPALELRVHAGPIASAPGLQVSRDRAHTIAVIDDQASARPVLSALRRAGVAEIDLLAARNGSRREADVVFAIRQRHRVREIWAPADHAIRSAITPPADSQVAVGAITVTIGAVATRLDIDVARVASPP